MEEGIGKYYTGYKCGCLTLSSVKRRKEKRLDDEVEYIDYTISCTCGRKEEHSSIVSDPKIPKEMFGADGLEKSLDRLFSIKRRKCGEYCGNRKWNIVKDENLVGKRHASLDVKAVVDEFSREWDYRFPFKYVHYTYSCRCYMCGKESLRASEDFKIIDTKGNGFRSNAYCDCYIPSSLEWRAIAVLRELGVNYTVQQQYFRLRGKKGGWLSYDFAVWGDSKSELLWLLECQGKQHYEPWNEDSLSFEIQQEHDIIKRNYAELLKVPLLEMSYKDRKFDERIRDFAKNHMKGE